MNFMREIEIDWKHKDVRFKGIEVIDREDNRMKADRNEEDTFVEKID